MQCDMCGKTTNLFRTMIEGAELNVCKDCGGHGKIFGAVKTKEEIKHEDERIRELFERKKAVKDIETNERIVEDYSSIIRRKRDSLGLTQEQFARKLNEKESILHNMEKGTFPPSIVLARKLERMLDIKLVEVVKGEVKIERSHSETMTLGDVINIKRK